MKSRVVTFHYTLHDTEGNLIDSSEGKTPLSYLEGVGNIISGLEEEMKKWKQAKRKNQRLCRKSLRHKRSRSYF